MTSSINFYKFKGVFLFVICFFSSIHISAQQNVSISDNQAVPDPSSVLDVSSTTKGLLIPRMTSVQRLAIVNPTNALMVFDTDSSCILFYQSSVSNWYSMCDYTQGPVGPQGDPGIHVDNSVVNSSGDLIVTLSDGTVINAGNVVGSSGTNGTNGIDGVDGADGAPGLPGADGADGADGAPGLPGADGADGVDGINGTNGTNGIDGVDGADGAPGPGWTLSLNEFNLDGTTTVNGTSGSGGPITSSLGAWLTSGNTAASANYIGTNNAIDFRTYTNGLERMTVESNGRVGIGTTTPDADLHSEGTFRITAGGDVYQKLNVAYVTGGYTFLDIHDGNSVVDFRLMTQGDSYLNGDGNIGIRTTTPSTYLHYSNASTINNFQTMWDVTNADDAVGRAQTSNANNGTRVWMGTTNYSGAVWAASGLMGLALNNSGTAIGVEGFSNSTAGTGVQAGFVGGTDITASGWSLWSDGWAGGTTAWQNFSDKRIKKNIQTIGGALQKIMLLRGVEFKYDLTNYPDLNIDTDTKQFGFVAQEVEQIFPEMVRNSKVPVSVFQMDNKMKRATEHYEIKTLSYSGIIPIIVEAMQEQQLIINNLSNDINNSVVLDALILESRIVASETGRMDTELYLASPSTKGLMFGVCEHNEEGEQIIRTEGIVFIDVDSSNGSIESGDFITVSSIGKALKSTNPEWVIGKALEGQIDGKVKVRIDFRFKQ